VAASLVAIGIVLNAVGSKDFDASSVSGVLMILGGVFTFFGLLAISFALTGAHTNEELSVKEAVLRRKPPSDMALEPQPLTPEYVEHQREYVGRLSTHNVTVIPLLRLSSFILPNGVYLTLFGFGWHVLG